MTNENKIINQVQEWVKKIVIGLNFCPFANGPFIKNEIKYIVFNSSNINDIDNTILQEIKQLQTSQTYETTLVITPHHFNSFQSFLLIIKRVERLLIKKKLQNEFLIAHFHPNYVFEGNNAHDVANYTNRSPYPILHIIKQKSIDYAKKMHKDIHAIPETNICTAKDKGLKYFVDTLKQIKNG